MPSPYEKINRNNDEHYSETITRASQMILANYFVSQCSGNRNTSLSLSEYVGYGTLLVGVIIIVQGICSFSGHLLNSPGIITCRQIRRFVKSEEVRATIEW